MVEKNGTASYDSKTFFSMFMKDKEVKEEEGLIVRIVYGVRVL